MAENPGIFADKSFNDQLRHRLVRSIVYYAGKADALRQPADDREQHRLELFRDLVSQRKALLRALEEGRPAPWLDN